MKFSNQFFNTDGGIRRLRLVAMFILLAVLASQAQTQKMIRCHTMENLERLIKEHPEYQLRKESNEVKIQQRLAQKKGEQKANPVVTIPVVFHVMHDGDAVGVEENISDAQILAQMAQLNDDYRRINSDAGSTPMEFQDEATDAEIEFCLASTDPNGSPTTGIERIDINTLAGVNLADCWDQAYIDTRIKTPTIWNSNLYLNVWVVEKIDNDFCSPTVLGYAQFPDLGPENTDGVVIISTSAGSIASPAAGGSPYDLGRTLTHEVGHWLHLYHIWGDDGGACSGSDQVDDTPNQGDRNLGCPVHPKMSCGNNEMFMNYMDYTDDDCMNLFTAGQAERMHAAVEEFRPGVVSDACGNCPENLVLTQTEPGTLTATTGFDADIEIQASNNIASGAVVEYRAGESIRLLPDPDVPGTGFWAQSGSTFRAYIADCDGGTKIQVRNESATPVAKSDLKEMSVFPNPFDGSFSVQFEIPAQALVTLTLSDALGRQVSQPFAQKPFEAGEHVFQMNDLQLPVGIYYLELKTPSARWVQKLVKVNP